MSTYVAVNGFSGNVATERVDALILQHINLTNILIDGLNDAQNEIYNLGVSVETANRQIKSLVEAVTSIIKDKNTPEPIKRSMQEILQDWINNK